MPVPRFWSGSLDQTDLSPNIILPATALPQASIVPNQIGLPIINKSGGTINAGQLVYINGWDATSGRQTIAKANANAVGTLATWVVLASILNNATGTVGRHFSLTAQNTNAATVGDAVYLDTTSGGYTMTTPPAAGVAYQQVGRVTVKSASVGVVDFDLESGNAAPAILPLRASSAFGVIATTGTTESNPIIMGSAGSIVGFRLAFLSALAINGTNYVTFSVNNRTQTLLLTSAAVANSTNTGGQAITQYGGFVLTVTATPANLVFAAGDVITCSAVVTGTLGATLQGSWSIAYMPS